MSSREETVSAQNWLQGLDYRNIFVIKGIYITEVNGGSTAGQLDVQSSRRKYCLFPDGIPTNSNKYE